MVKLQEVRQGGRVKAVIASTEGTRRICNDTTCFGVDYTNLLSDACAQILVALKPPLEERSTAVLNILRGGLNYGLREALSKAFGWQLHATCFLSAQRVCNGGDDWHITENAYRKVRLPRNASLVIGDVVATGTSLEYALGEIVEYARSSGKGLGGIVFFTYGGRKALEILEKVDARCRELFPEYKGTTLVYLEGVFTVPDANTPLSIKLPGTDLLRYGAEMSDAFLESQYEDPAYPIERCIIYDAGSRAFAPDEYLQDVLGYWQQTLALARSGVTYRQLLTERLPVVDADRFPETDLTELCLKRIKTLKGYLQ